MTPAILVLNAGSSSVKFAVYAQTAALPMLLRGGIAALGHAPRLSVRSPGEADHNRLLGHAPMLPGAAGLVIFDELARRGMTGAITAVGHRIVHGGLHCTQPTILTAAIIDQLTQLVPLAPLHQPANLEMVALARHHLPGALQVGAFDTAFHADRPHLDRLYALPRDLSDDGIVAYGFHGLSYAHIAAVLRARAGPRAGGRTIVAHLGSGASLCAMNAGQSIATTMGFSALDGLVMSTRCGALDPAIVLHLMQQRQMSAEAVHDMLHNRSGLLGVSQISGDMATLLQSADPRAAEAVALFVYRAGRAIGSLAAALGGLDTLVFTAGIGENAPHIRALICQSAAWLGARMDAGLNRPGETVISAKGSGVEILVIPADEERTVAAGVLACMRQGPDAPPRVSDSCGPGA